MKLLQISQLPPPNLQLTEAVEAFWTDQMNGHRNDPTAKVTVVLPRQGSSEHLLATAKAALGLQKSMGSRFQFTDKMLVSN